MFAREHPGSTSELWVVAASGDGERRLGPSLPAIGQGSPAWSPDGRRILFSRHGHLYVMSATGRHVKRLTHGRGRDITPAWFGAAPTRTTVDASPEPVSRGATLTVAGTLTKVGIPLPRAEVTIRFKARGARRYATVAVLRTDSSGSYQLTRTARRTGVWRAIHPASAATLSSSDRDTVRVRR